MNLQTIRGKKSLKLIFLLLTSLLIATVSATIYSYMYIDGSVTVGTAKLVWIAGSDVLDASISGGTVTIDLDVQPGQLQSFTYGLYLKNQDTDPHNMTINVTTPLSGTYFTTAKMHIYMNSTGSFVHTIDMTTSDSYATSPLSASGVYRLTFEIYATTGASGPYNFDIQVEYQ
jgi:hypothetical protein